MVKPRVCIIGNSHAVALRVGLDLAPELEEQFSFDFFAAQSDRMREIELRGTVFVPTSEITKRRMSIIAKGKTEIETTNYSHFVIVGLGFNVIDAVNALRRYQIHGFQGKDNAAVPYLSRACFAALIESLLRASTSAYFARLLRSINKASIVVMPQPYPSADILMQEAIWKKTAQNGLLSYVVQLYEDVARRVINDLQCEILFQSPSTLLQDGITQAKYAADSILFSRDMSTKHPSSESFHMNASYGAEILRSYVQLIRQ